MNKNLNIINIISKDINLLKKINKQTENSLFVGNVDLFFSPDKKFEIEPKKFKLMDFDYTISVVSRTKGKINFPIFNVNPNINFIADKNIPLIAMGAFDRGNMEFPLKMKFFNANDTPFVVEKDEIIKLFSLSVENEYNSIVELYLVMNEENGKEEVMPISPLLTKIGNKKAIGIENINEKLGDIVIGDKLDIKMLNSGVTFRYGKEGFEKAFYEEKKE